MACLLLRDDAGHDPPKDITIPAGSQVHQRRKRHSKMKKLILIKNCISQYVLYIYLVRESMGLLFKPKVLNESFWLYQVSLEAIEIKSMSSYLFEY